MIPNIADRFSNNSIQTFELHYTKIMRHSSTLIDIFVSLNVFVIILRKSQGSSMMKHALIHDLRFSMNTLFSSYALVSTLK